MNSNVHDVIL